VTSCAESIMYYIWWFTTLSRLIYQWYHVKSISFQFTFWIPKKTETTTSDVMSNILLDYLMNPNPKKYNYQNNMIPRNFEKDNYIISSLHNGHGNWRLNHRKMQHSWKRWLQLNFIAGSSMRCDSWQTEHNSSLWVSETLIILEESKAVIEAAIGWLLWRLIYCSLNRW